MKKIKSLALIATLFVTFFICGSTTNAATVDSKRSDAVVGFYNGDTSSSSDTSDSSDKGNVTNPSNGADNSNKNGVTSYPKTGSENQNYLVIIGISVIGISTIIYLFKKKKESEQK